MRIIDSPVWICIVGFITTIGSGCCIADKTSKNLKIVKVGSNLQLACAPPDAEAILHYFTWSKDGALLPDKSISRAITKYTIQGDFSLLVENVTEDDDGIYTCSIESDPPVITNYTVQVRASPSIGPTPADGKVSVAEGDHLQLICIGRGRPVPEVVWKYQGSVLDGDSYNQTIHPNRSVVSTYRINNVGRRDAGTYSCEARNGIDEPAVTHFDVQIHYAPEIGIEEDWVHAGLGSFAELVCLIQASPAAQVTWFRLENGENVAVASSSRIGTVVIGSRHVLRFKNVRSSDLGHYVCRAVNMIGRAEGSVEMSGQAKPAILKLAAPRDGHKLEAEGKAFRLIWDVTSHSPIYEYLLWLRPQGQPRDQWINIIIPAPATSSSSFLHSHSYTLSDLGTGIVYEVTVQSRNRYGWSRESNAIQVSGATSDDYANEADQEASILFPSHVVTVTLLSNTTESNPDATVRTTDKLSTLTETTTSTEEEGPATHQTWELSTLTTANSPAETIWPETIPTTESTPSTALDEVTTAPTTEAAATTQTVTQYVRGENLNDETRDHREELSSAKAPNSSQNNVPTSVIVILAGLLPLVARLPF